MKYLQIILLTLSLCSTTYSQNLPLIKISDDHKFFVTEQGQPFFWLGGTAWELIHRATREEVDLYLNDRKNKGFTIIQTVILAELDGLNTPNAYGHKPLIDNDPTQINAAYFQHVDYVIDKAAELGLYIGLLPTWGDKFHKAWGIGPEVFNPDNAKVFGEFLGKRYTAKSNIIWITGGDRWPKDNEDFEIIRAMVKGLKKYDTNHLITYHSSGLALSSDYFNDDEWLDFDMFQLSHSSLDKDFEFVWKARSVSPLRPVVNSEPRYEDHPNRFNGALYGWLDDYDVRVSAYWSMLAGAAGYTYGCHDIWQMFDPEREPVNGSRTNWKVALNLPGSRQLHYLKNLLESFPWQQMENDQTIIANDNKIDSTFMAAGIGKAKDFMILYTPMGRPISPNLSKLNAKKVIAYWYNPRDGSSKKLGKFNVSEQFEFKPWSQGRGSDFVLVIMDENADYVLPKFKK